MRWPRGTRGGCNGAICLAVPVLPDLREVAAFSEHGPYLPHLPIVGNCDDGVCGPVEVKGWKANKASS